LIPVPLRSAGTQSDRGFARSIATGCAPEELRTGTRRRAAIDGAHGPAPVGECEAAVLPEERHSRRTCHASARPRRVRNNRLDVYGDRRVAPETADVASPIRVEALLPDTSG